MKVKKLLEQAFVFVLWAIHAVLGFWMVTVIQSALLTALTIFYVGDSDSYYPRWRVRAVGQLYYPIAGLIFLIFIFLVYGYLQDGLPERDTLRRFAHVAGIQLLIVFPADLFLSVVQESLIGPLSRVILPLQLVVGAGLLAYSIITRPKRKTYPTGGS